MRNMLSGLLSNILNKCVYTPPEEELVKSFSAVDERQTNTKGLPRCIGGGTYAKELPNLVAFGPSFLRDGLRIHKSDEYSH